MTKTKVIKLAIGKEISGHEVRALVSSYRDFKKLTLNAKESNVIKDNLASFSNFVFDLINLYK